MDIIGIDAVVPLIVGILVWSLLMLGVEMGNAMSEAFDHRGH
jgi:hypothetical protein